MEERRDAIVELVNARGTVSFRQLKEAFPNVSEMTLRTDLKALDAEGRIVRIHGGARSVEQIIGTDGLLSTRTAKNTDAKNLIARKALSLIRPNTTVFLDSGSTTTSFAAALPDENLLIFTSGLTCAAELARLERPSTYLVGGKLNRYTPLVSREEYLTFDSHSILSKLYDGSPRKFVAALAKGGMTKQEVEDLRSLLDQLGGGDHG